MGECGGEAGGPSSSVCSCTGIDCRAFVADLASVVEKRTAHYATSLSPSDGDSLGRASCGLPKAATSPQQLRSRVACLAPFICDSPYRAWLECRGGGGGRRDCTAEIEQLTGCLGRGTSKLGFLY